MPASTRQRKPKNWPRFYFRPSSAQRQVMCPGSTRLITELTEAGIITYRTSSAAERGRLLHTCAEHIMRTRKMLTEAGVASIIADYPESGISTEEAPEMRALVRDAAMSLLGEVKLGDYTDHRIEQQLSLRKPVPCRGILDFAATHKDGTHHIIVDWKFGHVRVPVEQNRALLLYAVMAYGLKCDIPIHAYIVQPDNAGEWHSHRWVITPAARVEHLRQLETALDDDRFAPDTDTCRWCDAAPFCPAYHSMHERLGQVYALSDQVILEKPVEALADLYQKVCLAASIKKPIEDWVRSHGDGVPGFKMLPGRALARKYSATDDTLREVLGKKYKAKLHDAPRKLLSPTQLEKADAEAYQLVSAYVEQGQAQPRVVCEVPSLVDQRKQAAAASDASLVDVAAMQQAVKSNKKSNRKKS